ncbi:MBL fold metallo-hydrolase [Luteimonas gilva]|uniref:MBL fold metallo-hydrolase n=1 Tax=Luteimonas gilva TaxID=2572684 RepID=A0A4U5JUQ8_9GAMM|nr:MBL fold metallo-hydrolase [Luteimonas gilva]TKR30159.1 MBL fold metallo-hydrolase [Luteimonas gilva]
MTYGLLVLRGIASKIAVRADQVDRMASNLSVRVLRLASLSLSLALCFAAFAANAPAPAQAESDILQRALDYSRLPATTSAVELDMRGLRYTPDQARTADVAIAKVEAKQTVLIDRDGRFRWRTRTLYPGNIEFGFLTVGSASGSATIDELKWRDGIQIDRETAESSREDHADLLFLAPALLLRDASARGAKVATEGASATVAFQDGAGRAATLTLDPASGQVLAASVGPRSYAYSEYREVAGLRQPGRIEQSRDGKLNYVWSDVSLRAAAAPAAEFVLPPGYVEKSSPGPLRATPLGEGAYRIDGAPSGYHTGFVVGDRSVVVFDAPIAPEEAAKVKAEIERAAPGRRIAYVVVSHAHGDHFGGLPAYLADGDVEVFAGAHAGVALKRNLGDKAPAKLTELAAHRRIDLGGKRVDLYPIDSGHSETMLVGYAPESRTVFQGDLFFLPEVGPVQAAFAVGEELAALIESQHLDVVNIVGVHGRSGKRADLTEALRLRKAQARPPAAAASCGNSSDPEKVVQAQLDAYNAHDLDTFVSCYAEGVAIHNLSSDKPPRKGLRTLREDYLFLKEAPKAYRAERANRIVSGPIVVDHELIRGLPPERGVPEAIAVYEVRDGKILNVWFPPRK